MALAYDAVVGLFILFLACLAIRGYLAVNDMWATIHDLKVGSPSPDEVYQKALLELHGRVTALEDGLLTIIKASESEHAALIEHAPKTAEAITGYLAAQITDENSR